MAQVVERLLSKHEPLSSNSNTGEKKKKKKKKEKKTKNSWEALGLPRSTVAPFRIGAPKGFAKQAAQVGLRKLYRAVARRQRSKGVFGEAMPNVGGTQS
jgi:hypothetical protein